VTFEDNVRAAVRRGDHATVLRLAAAEVDRAQTAGDPDGQVAGLTAMARVALDCHDLSHAEILARTALGVAADSGEPRLEQGPQDVLAAVARRSGDGDRPSPGPRRSTGANPQPVHWPSSGSP
jgi:hypothetical protein